MFDDARSSERTGAGNGAGTATIDIAGGDGNISLTKFSPEGITIKVGTTLTWHISEASGDPHVLVFNADTQGKDLNPPLYTGLTPDGGLRVNSQYVTQTLPIWHHSDYCHYPITAEFGCALRLRRQLTECDREYLFTHLRRPCQYYLCRSIPPSGISGS